MKFSETIKLADPGLVVSKRHEAWITELDHHMYSQRAIDFAQAQLGSVGRKRSGTISASSLGECGRYQQFVYLGMPKLLPDAKNAAKMANGSFMHLRWQMEGLTEGWLSHAEVPLDKNVFGLSGTMDGLLYDDSILELKSINTNGFSRVVTFGPLIPHLFQMATYMMCSGIDKGVFIYENKDNQEYKEIVVTPNDVDFEETRIRAEWMWGSTVTKKLHEPLGKCIDREGWEYNSCPFRDRCLSITSWEEVG